MTFYIHLLGWIIHLNPIKNVIDDFSHLFVFVLTLLNSSRYASAKSVFGTKSYV